MVCGTLKYIYKKYTVRKIGIKTVRFKKSPRYIQTREYNGILLQHKNELIIHEHDESLKHKEPKKPDTKGSHI